MVKLLIIADDFTGALDTGVEFAKKGIETQVFTGNRLEGGSISQTAQVLVVDSETRPMDCREAYETVAQIVRQAVDLGVEVIYKKTDSALRGNVGSELSAVVDAAGGDRIYFIPAFPKVHRTTEKGIHYIDGVYLEESGFGKDPFDPMTCSYVPDILAAKTDKRILSVERGQAVPQAGAEKEILVFDAVTDEDIRARAEELKAGGALRLIAGCAGFASFLPELLGLTGDYRGEIRKTDGFYVACGSVNPITKAQVEYAAEKGFYRTTLRPEQKLDSTYLDSEDGRKWLEDLKEKCRTGKRVIVDSFDPEDGETTVDYAQRHGISTEELRFAISTCHGRIVQYLLTPETKSLDMTILMTGGDTLMGFMKEIGVNQLQIAAEVGQGTVLSRLTWGERSLQVISKSGGFGEKEVLVNIAGQVMK